MKREGSKLKDIRKEAKLKELFCETLKVLYKFQNKFK